MKPPAAKQRCNPGTRADWGLWRRQPRKNWVMTDLQRTDFGVLQGTADLFQWYHICSGYISMTRFRLLPVCWFVVDMNKKSAVFCIHKCFCAEQSIFTLTLYIYIYISSDYVHNWTEMHYVCPHPHTQTCSVPFILHATATEKHEDRGSHLKQMFIIQFGVHPSWLTAKKIFRAEHIFKYLSDSAGLHHNLWDWK